MQDEDPPAVEGYRLLNQAIETAEGFERGKPEDMWRIAEGFDTSYRVLVKRIEAALRIILEHPESPHSSAQKALEVLDGD